MSEIYDALFAHAVRRAAKAFTAAKGKDPSIEGLELAEMLRSGFPIGEGERELLAEFVTGEWRRRAGEAGKARQVHPESDIVKAVVSELREKVKSGTKKEAAKLEVASQFEVSRGTVENYEKMVLEREAAHSRGRDSRFP